MKGAPQIVIVDDFLPVDMSYKPLFAKFGPDNSIWTALLEKAWAKTIGNYQFIQSGHSDEAVEFLTNSPSSIYYISDLSSTSFWTLVKNADEKNYVMNIGSRSSGRGDQDTCEFGLPCAHSYSLLGVATVYSSNKTPIYLLKIRNPHGKDTTFSGAFRDKSS